MPEFKQAQPKLKRLLVVKEKKLKKEDYSNW